MTSGTVSSLFFLLLSCTPALAQTQQAQFNQVLNINGDMNLNSFQFPDRSKVETFSQKQQQLIVNQNTPPVPANQVTGSTGQPFVALMSQSMSINTNNATDLVGGQIELAMDPQMLATNAVNPDNAFVAQLSPDRQTWMIQETMRSVNISDMTVRMVKRQTIDGEYMVIGRQTVETNTVLTPFGSDPSTQVAIQGTGLQENEFQDGFRMSVRATQPMTMNVDVKEGIDMSQLAALPGQQPVNDFRYSVNSNLAGVQPSLNRQVTVIQMPLNAQRIQNMMQAAGIQPGGQVQLSVAQRGILGNPGGATGNLGGAATAPIQRRGREAFRQNIAGRQVQGATQQAGQQQAGQQQAGQQQAGQQQTGQQQTGQQQAGQQQAGQQQAGQQQAGQQQAGQQQAGQQQAGQQQAGTPTNGNNPVATQLLLSPTFTPIQAQIVLDPVNMRVAFPVSAVDGEFIMTMQTAAAQPQAQPQAAAPQPAAPQAAEPPTPAGEATPATEAPKPAAEGAASNGTARATEGEKKPERRQEKREPAAAINDAPQGSFYLTMREVNMMVDIQAWGGQAPISKMMNDFVMASNGTKTA